MMGLLLNWLIDWMAHDVWPIVGCALGFLASSWWTYRQVSKPTPADPQQRRRAKARSTFNPLLVAVLFGVGTAITYNNFKINRLYARGSAYAVGTVTGHYAMSERRSAYVYSAAEGWHKLLPGARSPITLYYTYEVGEWRYQGRDVYPGPDSSCPLTPGARCWVRYPLANPRLSQLVLLPADTAARPAASR